MGKEYKHISLQERDMMAVYKAKRLNPSQIAEKLAQINDLPGTFRGASRLVLYRFQRVFLRAF